MCVQTPPDPRLGGRYLCLSVSWQSDFSSPQEESRHQDFSTPSNFWYPAELNKREGVRDQLHSHDRKLRRPFQPQLLLLCPQHAHSNRKGLSKHEVSAHVISFAYPDCPSHPPPPSSVPFPLPGDLVGLSLAPIAQQLKLVTEQDPPKDPTPA